MPKIQTYILGPMQTNSYLCQDSDCAFVVDPGGDPKALLKALDQAGLHLEAIVNTHLHFDHTLGNSALQRATNAPIYAPQADEQLLSTELGAGGFMDLPEVEPFSFEPLRPGKWELCGLECQVLITPGHTAGSISLYLPGLEAIFVGDLIFAGSIGRTDFPGGDLEQLLSSVRKEVFALPEQTRVYPGHWPQTTVGQERASNPFFKA
jgi:glyoxylase-like metal-dependent hydrolase (beta-lactamase superfamily II)